MKWNCRLHSMLGHICAELLFKIREKNWLRPATPSTAEYGRLTQLITICEDDILPFCLKSFYVFCPFPKLDSNPEEPTATSSFPCIQLHAFKAVSVIFVKTNELEG
jgi:hypothetical protein